MDQKDSDQTSSDYQIQKAQIYGLIESMTTGLIMFDTKPEISVSNSAFKKIFDISPDQTISLAQMIHSLNQLTLDHRPEDTSKTADQGLLAETGKGVWEKVSYFQAVEITLQRGKTVRYPEVSLKNKFFEINIIPVYSQEKIIGGAMMFHDITELIEVDRMKSEFVSVASHQLRTPLTSMRLFIEMLLAKQVGELTKTQEEYIQNLEESTMRMIKLVNEFLNVSRLENGRLKIDPQITDLKDFIQDVIDKVKILGKEKNISIEFVPPQQNLLSIPIDQTLMHEVLKNLISNAISYSPANTGKVTVRLEMKNNPVDVKDIDLQVLDSEFIHYQIPDDKTLAAFFPQSYYLISIQDNGMGIPPEVQPEIFQKFFRADNAIKARSEGSGLGLYLVKMIVESSKGQIWFKSELGKGTTFYVALPAYGMLPRQGEKSLAIS